MYRCSFVVVAAVLLLGVACTPESHDLALLPVPANPAFPDATATAALHHACAPDAATLKSHFLDANLPFQPDLLQQRSNSVCHIFYQPAAPGFQASSDSGNATGIRINLNPLAFYSAAPDDAGDTLSITRAILSHLRQPIDVTIHLPAIPDSALSQSALRANFPSSPHNLQIHSAPSQDAPWAQDFFKPGQLHGQPRTLLPHRAFEGSAAIAEQTQPLLDSFQNEPFLRSKLSWEGGDLQFVRHPQYPDQLILFYGDSAKQYWAPSLSIPEFEYILKLEFGADRAIPLTGLTAHVDYSVAFLDSTALLAEPVCQRPDIATAAIDLWLQQLPQPAPPELLQLRQSPFDTAALAAVKSALPSLPWPSRQSEEQPILDYVARHCPARPTDCIAPPSLVSLIANHKPLAHSWISIAAHRRLRSLLPQRILQIVEGQRASCAETARRFTTISSTLTQLGFHVVRVPWLPPAPNGHESWAGISYTNAAFLQDTLFLPTLGLADLEKTWFRQIQKQLPNHIRLVPIPARQLLLENGGIHCMLAFDRLP